MEISCKFNILIKAVFTAVILVALFSTYVFASTGQDTVSVRLGIFNTEKAAQTFFDNFPPQLQDRVHKQNFKIKAAQSGSVFTEIHAEISDVDSALFGSICIYAFKKEVQCVVSEVTSIKSNKAVATPDILAPIHKGTKVLGDKKKIQKPVFAQALDVRLPDPIYTASELPLTIQESLERYGEGFSFKSREPDSLAGVAAKAAYLDTRDRFLYAIKNIGEGINQGDVSEAASQEVLALGRSAFEAAGQAYLSGFLSAHTPNVAHALSQEANAGEVFIHHVRQNLNRNVDNTVKQVMKQAFSGFISGQEKIDEAFKKRADAFFINGARGFIDAGLATARQSDLYALRNIELEYTLNDFDNSYFSILLTQPLYQSADLRHNVFLQGGGIINEKSVDVDDDTARHTLNMGAAYRYLTPDERYLFGGNVFLDHQWPYDHTRMSVGLDARADNLNVATNYYIPLSGYKQGRTDAAGQQYEERVLEGYDFEVGYEPSSIPRLDVYGRGYHYFRENGEDDLLGLELGGGYDITPRLKLKGAFIEENGGRDGIEIGVQYHSPLYDVNKPNLAALDMPEASMRGHIFDKVRRENRIRVQERTAIVAVPFAAQFNGASTGLPFFVGGISTSSGADIPYDTAIAVPNGDFAVLNFTNGAIANVSASGTGNVVLEYNETTLTITSTNGGFVQYVSGTGGITTVNVPGGTVNLLGTDIDVTDNGTTTTIQVRAGQVSVVPTIGGATQMGSQGDIVSLGIASGATSLLVDPALETRQEAAFTNLDLINPTPPSTNTSAPYINALPTLITGPQFIGNNADIRVTFTQGVTVTGAPQLTGFIDANARNFIYESSASSATQLVFRHVYVAGDVGAAGITIQELDLNSGTIISSANALNAVTAFTDTIVVINDATAPMLLSSTPADDDLSFSSGGNIVLNFNENIQANVGNITLTDVTDNSSTTIIPIGDAQVTISGSTLTINPTGILDLATDYDLTIGAGIIQDTAGNAFAGITAGNLNFTTSNDVTPPILTGSTPADAATGLARNSTITLTFDENVMLLGTINLIDTDNGSGTIAYTSASAEVNVLNNVITITPAVNFEYAENYEVTWITGAIQDLVGNNAAASNSGDLNFKTIDLESTLTLTLNITGVDGDIDETNIQSSGTAFARTSDAVMAAEITIPASPNGVVFEGGGTGIGAWVGFNNADGVLRARAGDGVAVPTALAANAEVALGSIPAGNHTLTWEFDVALGRVRVWLDENLIASNTASSNMFEANTWGGTDNFGYGAITGSNGSLGTGEITTAFNGTLLGNMRYYSGQTLP